VPCVGPGGRSKKSLIATERDEAARATWRTEMAGLNPAELIFVDETSTHTALTRRRARAPRGQRAVGAVPRNHGPNTTLVAALTPTGIGPALTIQGSVNSAAFIAYAQHVLAPSLRPGQVVVLDNLSAHKGEAARRAVEAMGARVVFLPAYSPDFNPIELAFAKIKQQLRTAAQRAERGLLAATAQAIDAVSVTDAHGFYAHCGFPLSTN
jgi:transposase